jgi:hypothetical protein
VLFDEKIVAIERTLESLEIPHAFGGANALAYYGTPRATADIDLNVFVPVSRSREVMRALGQLGVATDDPLLLERIDRDGQITVYWERTPIDVFFSYDPLHESSMQRRRLVDFGGDPIHVLSAEDLMVYKVVFNREKDWHDIAEMIYAANESLDFDYVRGWLERICSERQPLERLQRLIESSGREPA